MPKRTTTPTRKRYGPHTPVAECDRRDEKLRNVENWERTASQERFLTTYTERPSIASAARAAGVARCTVYRWLAGIPQFEKAVRDAWEVAVDRNRERWEKWAEEREQWRREREKARRPMRCFYLAKARAAYKEALKKRGGRKRRPWTY
jgi:hypothetical protein